VQNISILLEHVDLLDTRDGLDTKLLESGLKLAVVSLRRGDRLLDDLASRGTLAACGG
jgi:hypothetical protein